MNPETLKGLLRLAAMAQAAQEAGKANEAEKAEAQAVDSTGCGNGQDPNEKQECTGQNHHLISKVVWYALEQHSMLRGKYIYRDPKFVARAKDLKSHCGYQNWHRDLDEAIRAWLQEHPEAGAKEFEAFLRELYARPELNARFPNGF
ncbi:MAG TPA: Wall-associated protein precursor [Myxococcaceae bacterium]